MVPLVFHVKTQPSEVLEKKMFLKISKNYACAGVSFLIKLQALAWQKETPAQVFSCEFW